MTIKGFKDGAFEEVRKAFKRVNSDWEAIWFNKNPPSDALVLNISSANYFSFNIYWSSPENWILKIDWGDGQFEEILAEEVSSSNIEHNYISTGNYEVSIWQDFSNEDLNSGVIYRMTLSQTGEKITSVSGNFPDTITSFSSCFAYCSSLTSIPENLFANNTAATSFGGCFAYCSSLFSIPENLFVNNTAVTSFSSCFHGCSSLFSIPENLFVNNTAVTSFSTCFYNCSSVTGSSIPLWEREPEPNGSYCYSNCSVDDWDYIPTSWGGGGLTPECEYEISYSIGGSAINASYASDVMDYIVAHSQYKGGIEYAVNANCSIDDRGGMYTSAWRWVKDSSYSVKSPRFTASMDLWDNNQNYRIGASLTGYRDAPSRIHFKNITTGQTKTFYLDDTVCSNLGSNASDIRSFHYGINLNGTNKSGTLTGQSYRN